MMLVCAILLALTLIGADAGREPPAVRCTTLDGGVRTCEVHQHCWHVSPYRHLVEHHVDEVCCRCGEARCRELDYFKPDYSGHGPYVPK